MRKYKIGFKELDPERSYGPFDLAIEGDSYMEAMVRQSFARVEAPPRSAELAIEGEYDRQARLAGIKLLARAKGFSSAFDMATNLGKLPDYTAELVRVDS